MKTWKDVASARTAFVGGEYFVWHKHRAPHTTGLGKQARHEPLKAAWRRVTPRDDRAFASGFGVSFFFCLFQENPLGFSFGRRLSQYARRFFCASVSGILPTHLLTHSLTHEQQQQQKQLRCPYMYLCVVCWIARVPHKKSPLLRANMMYRYDCVAGTVKPRHSTNSLTHSRLREPLKQPWSINNCS